jgi:hypothetical protein
MKDGKREREQQAGASRGKHGYNFIMKSEKKIIL